MRPFLLILPVLAVACRSAGSRAPQATDTTFAAMQSRGMEAMGVDQYTSAHQFDDLPEGGRIELQRDSTDTAGVRTIREHLQHISVAFKQGDFALPGFVHDEAVPGTAAMTANRALIDYRFQPLPGGGEVLITSTDSASVSAIHDFLAFQRQDHHAGGMVHHQP
jgi:hypothetical protein